MTVRAAWLLTGPPSGQTRTDTRLAPVGTMQSEGPLTSRSGVIAGGTPLEATGAGSMRVQISTGRAIVQGTSVQGAYPVAVTAPEVLVITDGHAQFDRIDTVVLRIYDQLFDISGQTLAQLEVLRGEANATPSAPPVPTGCLPLWDIAVPAGTSAGTGGITWNRALTDRRTYTSAYGGITPPGGNLNSPGAYPGQYRDNGRTLQRWDGLTWRDAVERHYASAFKSAKYNLTARQYTTVVWDGTDAVSEPGLWSPSAPTRLVAPVAGLYIVYAHQIWPGGATNARVRILVGGTGDMQVSYIATSSGGQGHAAARPVVLRASEFVEMSIYSDTALSGVDGSYSKLALEWRGP
ncbi:hypothetical protein [Streptomyces sp. BPTC-684]|uniref:hypothetical protein n=1 Tax=Streptomyces sp. BPTC-684 TaxID=3043734 RepID=UPI0024B1E373|nr:hypothetical protein [Streptomyces sp. BPTC-684]WHM36320.1 hypothetical protein QIY60_04820 [Streptomyces sp. BPTC-684]